MVSNQNPPVRNVYPYLPAAAKCLQSFFWPLRPPSWIGCGNAPPSPKLRWPYGPTRPEALPVLHNASAWKLPHPGPHQNKAHLPGPESAPGKSTDQSVEALNQLLFFNKSTQPSGIIAAVDTSLCCHRGKATS